MKRQIRSAMRSLYRGGVNLVACILLTPVVLAFLIRHRRLFDASLVMPFYVGSFGNSFLVLDFAARLYDGNQISLVMVRDPGQNAYLPSMFRKNMTLYWVGTMGFNPYTVAAVLRTLVYVLCRFLGRASVIEWQTLHYTLAHIPERVTGSEERDRLLPTPYDKSGYVYLLEQGIGTQPGLPPDLIERCKSYIAARYPGFFDRPFITLLLRAKGQDDPELSTRYRSSGPMENYRAAVAHAISRGYHVVGAGETQNSAFADVPGFFDLGEVPGAPGLLNLFLLSHCALFWGQHSGPVVVANSCGIPCLITDALPYCSGTFGSGGKDIVLYKPLTLRGENAPLDMVELYTLHQDLAHGYGFARKGVTIGFSGDSDILKAMAEALDRLSSPAPADVLALAEKWRDLIEPSMLVRFQSSRPPEFILRGLLFGGGHS